MKLTVSQDRLLGLIIVFMAALLAGLLFDRPANADWDRGDEPEQDQRQGQEQEQGQSQDQWQNQDQANEQNATVNNSSDTRVYAAGASSGDSNALCQQVRDVRVADGFLFGLRFDLTHEDCLRLQMASGAYGRDQIDFGNTLTCTTKIAREVYPSVVDCKASLEQTSAVKMLEDQVRQLEQQKADLLRERTIDQAQCEESKDRIAEGCRK